MAACLQNEYERDYIIEALMQDRLHQKQKYRKKSFDLRRTTKAHEGYVKGAKKRLAGIKEKETSENHRMHTKRNSVPAKKYKKESARGVDFIGKGIANKPIKARHSELELNNEK